MSFDVSFGRHLSARRHLLGLTQYLLARKAGCSVVTIRKLEADERRPSLEVAECLAESLQIPADERQTFLDLARGTPPRSEVPADAIAERTLAGPARLAMPLTPLIGRAQDVAAVRNRLLQADERLLTLIGPPGIGKTRLSLAVAQDMLVAGHFPGGVYVVALAPISDPDRVLPAIAQAVGVVERGDASMAHHLPQVLRDKRMLLVLDNFEQVVAAAPQIAELLQACPAVKVLATSRTSLRVRGERLYPVPPLLLPDLARLAAPVALARVPTVELFVERAESVLPDFQLTSENAADIAAICVRLDGLPLAIELVAAQVRLLPPRRLLQGLASRLALDTPGPRDLPPRHRTLRSAIAWSYDLLEADEQALFRRLGMCVGGFTLEAAAAIGGDWEPAMRPWDALPAMPEAASAASSLGRLQTLLDHSLIVRSATANGEMRFGMLETIREYAREQLDLQGETKAARQIHAAYYVALAEAVEPEALLPHPLADQEILERDHDNLRAVLAWSLRLDATPEERAWAQRLVGTLHWFWNARGYTGDALRWIQPALTELGPPVPGAFRLRLMRAAGWTMHECRNWAAVLRYAQEELALAHELGNSVQVGTAMRGIADVAVEEGRYDDARAILEEHISLAQSQGEPLSMAYSITRLGVLAERCGDYRQAVRYFQEGLAWCRDFRIPVFVGMMLNNLARATRLAGDEAMALELHREGLQIIWEHGWHRGIPESLEAIARIAAGRGEGTRAALLLGAAHLHWERNGRPQIRVSDEGIDLIRARMDEATFAQAWADGQAMTLQQAVVTALEVASACAR